MPQKRTTLRPMTLCLPVDYPPREKVVVPDYLSRLGTRPSQYFEVLTALSKHGSREATVALRVLDREAKAARLHFRDEAFAAIDKDHIAPVDLGKSARWKLDAFGVVALQAVLWLWQARLHPRLYRSIANFAATQGKFSDETPRGRWWLMCKWLLKTRLPNRGDVPELARLIPTSCRGSAAARRKFVLRRIHQRIVGFAPPALTTR
jgi:hypothetical protein